MKEIEEKNLYLLIVQEITFQELIKHIKLFMKTLKIVGILDFIDIHMQKIWHICYTNLLIQIYLHMNKEWTY